jgi:hypothetical protein
MLQISKQLQRDIRRAHRVFQRISRTFNFFDVKEASPIHVNTAISHSYVTRTSKFPLRAMNVHGNVILHCSDNVFPTTLCLTVKDGPSDQFLLP